VVKKFSDFLVQKLNSNKQVAMWITI